MHCTKLRIADTLPKLRNVAQQIKK